MEEKVKQINAVYVMAVALMYKNSLDREFFDKAVNELKVLYDIDLSPNNINLIVLEWKDFFKISSENKVIFTKQAILNKTLVRFLFCDCLQSDIYDNIVNVVLNKGIVIEKKKVLKFPL